MTLRDLEIGQSAVITAVGGGVMAFFILGAILLSLVKDRRS